MSSDDCVYTICQYQMLYIIKFDFLLLLLVFCSKNIPIDLEDEDDDANLSNGKLLKQVDQNTLT